MLGASMVKYTIALLCIGSSESDLKLYNNFEFCEGKVHKHLRKKSIYKAKQFLPLPTLLTMRLSTFNEPFMI